MSLIETLQGDVAGYLAAEGYFADIPILNVDKGVTDSDVELALTTLNEKSGKLGACVAVFPPTGVRVQPNLPGPVLELSIALRIIESPGMNRDTVNGGTGKTAEAVLEKVMACLDHWKLGDSTLLAADFSDRDLGDDAVGKDVNFKIRRQVPPVSRVADVAISASALTVTLTCATSGAAIYYTTDGTFPGSANAAALLYAAPFVVTSGTLVRAAAFKSGLSGSNVTRLPV